MANISASLKDWSTTEASNQPDGTDSATIAGDLRAIQAGIRDYFSQSTIASAATTDIGANDAGYLAVSGTTTITAFGTVSAGIVKRLKFDGAVTVTHNATSLILPGAANITTAAGDILWMESLGSGNWRCIGYLPATGSAVTTSNTVTLTNKTLTSPTIGGSPSAAGATWSNLGAVTTVDINGGTLDGAVIGGSSRAAASVSSLTSTGNIVVDSTGVIGYTTGAGGSVTQLTSKSTGVTLNTSAGRITMDSAALAAGAIVSFTVTNSRVSGTDTIVLNHHSGGTLGAYTLNASPGTGNFVITLRNNTAGSLSEAVAINFTVVKGSTT